VCCCGGKEYRVLLRRHALGNLAAKLNPTSRRQQCSDNAGNESQEAHDAKLHKNGPGNIANIPFRATAESRSERERNAET
jgi:hypothetical protein